MAIALFICLFIYFLLSNNGLECYFVGAKQIGKQNGQETRKINSIKKLQPNIFENFEQRQTFSNVKKLKDHSILLNIINLLLKRSSRCEVILDIQS